MSKRFCLRSFAAVSASLLFTLSLLAQEATPEATDAAPVSTDVELIPLPEVDVLALSGDIDIAGSSTVAPLTERLAEEFNAEGFLGTIAVESIGTGGGFSRFCEGDEVDIVDASRPAQQDEIDACAAVGRTLVEFRVGTDALTVVVSASNTFVENLSLAQLSGIFGGRFRTWDQVDPSFPAEPIRIFSPGLDSGTFDFFLEQTLQQDASVGGFGLAAEAAVALASQVPGITLSEDDFVLVEGVQADPYAIGYFGYAYFVQEAEALRAVAIEGVLPSQETAESGEYLLSRPLFLYSAPEVLAAEPHAAVFLNYYLQRVNDFILDVGYFPASNAALNEARQNWLNATGAGA
jgi:phosphate binding protein